MSLYSAYKDYINSIVNLDKTQWTFKSNHNYNRILEHVSSREGESYLFEISNRFNEIYNIHTNYLISICHENDLYGSTNKSTFRDFTTCSPTNLRYILHSLLILSFMTECRLDSIDIIEIGGGYGGLCFFIKKLAILFNIHIKTYTMFDLPEALLLQTKYLEALNISNVNFMELNNFKNLQKNSFLISNYAFSEIDMNLQKEYTNKILNPYVSYGFLAWNFIPLYTFIDNKNIMKEIEFPLTGGLNHYVRFTPNNII